VKTWIVLLAILACLVFFTATAPDVVGALLFGWAVFLNRVLGRMAVDRGTVAVCLTALVLFTAGIHAAGRSWRRTAEKKPAWSLRCTVAAVAILFVLFAAGVALVGIVHQVGWLAASAEPFRVETVKSRWRGNSSNNLRQIAMALHNYADTYGSLPQGGSFTPEGGMLHSWETHTLVFIGYSPSTIDLKIPWNDPRNTPSFQSVLPVFLNPDLTGNERDADGYGLSHYAANVEVMGPNRSLKLNDITDGTANTLLVGEVNAHFQPWGHPVNWRDPAKGVNRSPHGFGGAPEAGGANFVMADGSVRFVSEKVDTMVLRALGTPNGGEPIDVTALDEHR
jgi:prepilin-type processing-associated H-X9-DG protein